MGSSKQPSHTTQTTKVELPAWVDGASRENYGFAEAVANRPLQQYQGNTVAGRNGDQMAADQFLRDRMGSTGPVTDAAVRALGASSIFQPERVGAERIFAGSNGYDRVRAGLISETDLNPYMNPFREEVENNALRAVRDTNTQLLMGNADKAVNARAFGGSRSGIVDAVTNSESIKTAGDLSAQLRAMGFDKAAGLATGDLDRTLTADLANQSTRMQTEAANADRALRAAQSNQSAGLQASTANQSAGLAANGQRIQGALGLNTVGNDAQTRYLRDYGALSEIGGNGQTQSQREIDAEIAKFMEQRDYPLDQLNIRLSALGMSPYGKTETATKTGTSERKGNDWASIGMGGLSMLAGMFSDRDEKTDIKKLGTDPDTGIDMYSYRYKGDPKSYPKVVGPMAQDIEKASPGSTRRIGGKMVVNA